jgi:hypothetical protein
MYQRVEAYPRWGPRFSADSQRGPTPTPGIPGPVIAMECVHLAPNAQVSLYPWKDTLEKIPLTVRHIRTFLRAHRPPIAARQPLAAAAR